MIKISYFLSKQKVSKKKQENRDVIDKQYVMTI